MGDNRNPRPDLRPHQEAAVEKLHNGCILWGRPGSGKSFTAAEYYIRNEAPKDVYVITTARKRDECDWQSDFARYGVWTEALPGVRGALTVDSWNNLAKYQDVQGAFFIFDEQRLVGSGAWTKAFIKLAKENRWILLSATPGDTWLDYIPVFVANGFYKNRTQFKAEHVVYNHYGKFPKVDRYVGTGKLVRLRNSILVAMPYAQHTEAVTTDIHVDYDINLWEQVTKRRWHVFKERPIRDVAELFSVMRKVVNSDASRYLAVRKLAMKHPKLIVFYNFDYELEMLRELAEEPCFYDLTREGSSWNETSESTCSSTADPSLGDTTAPTSQTDTSSAATSKRAQTAEEPSGRTGTLLRAQTLLRADTTSSCPMSDSPCPTTRHGSASAANAPSPWPSLSSGTTSSTATSTPTGAPDQRSEQRDGLTRSTTSSSPCSKSDPSLTSSSSTASADTSATATGSPSSATDAKPSTASFTVAEWNGHRHDPVPTTDRWIYLVQYVAGSEAWNCTDTDAMVFFSLTYSYKNWHQAYGRIDRMNTPFTKLYYYVLMSSSPIDKGVRAALRAKRSFNERSYSANTSFES